MINRIFRRTQHFFTYIVRDRRGMPSLLFVPVGLLLLMGWTIKSADNDITIGIVTEGDHWAIGEIALGIDETLSANDITTTPIADANTAEQTLRDGDIQGYVVIDDSLVDAVLGGEEDEVRVGVLGDDIAVKDEVLREIGRAVVIAPLQVLRESVGYSPWTDGEAVHLDTRYVYGGTGYDSFDQLLPALLAFLIFLTIFTSSLVFVANDRALHTLERVMATPMRRWEYITGAVLGYTFFAILQAISVIAAATYVLDAEYSGSAASILAVSIVVAITAVALATFLSAFARSESEAMQMLPLALIPQFIIGGVLFPVSALPDVLQQAARVLPVTYAVNALRDVMLRDHTLTDAAVLGDLAALAAFALLFVALGTRALQPEES